MTYMHNLPLFDMRFILFITKIIKHVQKWPQWKGYLISWTKVHVNRSTS